MNYSVGFGMFTLNPLINFSFSSDYDFVNLINMFETAIESVSSFTRPIHTISRSFGGLISPGASTLFFVNQAGVAVTCKHIASMILESDQVNNKFINYKAERKP